MNLIDNDAMKDVKMKRSRVEFLYEEIANIESEIVGVIDERCSSKEINGKCFYKRDERIHTLIRVHDIVESFGKVCVEGECFMFDEMDGEINRYTSFHINSAEFKQYSDVPNDVYNLIDAMYTCLSKEMVSTLKRSLLKHA